MTDDPIERFIENATYGKKNRDRHGSDFGAGLSAIPVSLNLCA